MKLTKEQKLELVPIYGNAILEDDIEEICLTCKHYDFEDNSEQICNNVNNYQLNDDNEANEKRYYKMMVTTNFGCKEWVK